MPSEKMRRRLDRLRGNMLPPEQIPSAIRSLVTLLGGRVKSDQHAEEIAKRYEPVFGPDGAREFLDMLNWARRRLAERGGLDPAYDGPEVLWSETWPITSAHFSAQAPAGTERPSWVTLANPTLCQGDAREPVRRCEVALCDGRGEGQTPAAICSPTLAHA